jgi:hypothetical protein
MWLEKNPVEQTNKKLKCDKMSIFSVFYLKIIYWCVLSLIAQAKIFSPRFPISLLHSSHLSCTRRKPYLVWGGVHSAVCGERPKIHDFSKISGDVPLWKIVSRDLLGRFGREYACWKGQIVYFKAKL